MAQNTAEKNILNEERKILAQEKEVLGEIKKEEKMLRRLMRNVWVMGGVILAALALIVGGLVYWNVVQSRVYIENSQISATQTDLAPQNAGILQEVFVKEGDSVPANTVVARVDNELIKAKEAGVVVAVNDAIGKLFNRGETVVSMINPADLRVVGHLEEDKGLQYVRVGQTAIFTVDAFGSKEYFGVVDEVSPSSRQGDVVFNISDQRPTNQFDIKVRFDTTQYPELKNGMSAKLWIYK
ncbi:MAG: HlyD family efflux transporter periplasmic adaptor subunit [Patescibacteria group bacterium]|nr:HlyD family efflux transporter periplasmic adaptor subunit [Patescibacteria group bacterium]